MAVGQEPLLGPDPPETSLAVGQEPLLGPDQPETGLAVGQEPLLGPDQPETGLAGGQAVSVFLPPSVVHLKPVVLHGQEPP